MNAGATFTAVLLYVWLAATVAFIVWLIVQTFKLAGVARRARARARCRRHGHRPGPETTFYDAGSVLKVTKCRRCGRLVTAQTFRGSHPVPRT